MTFGRFAPPTGRLAAHFEHTVILTKEGAKVTTVPNGPKTVDQMLAKQPNLSQNASTRYHSRPVSGTLLT